MKNKYTFNFAKSASTQDWSWQNENKNLSHFGSAFHIKTKHSHPQQPVSVVPRLFHWLVVKKYKTLALNGFYGSFILYSLRYEFNMKHLMDSLVNLCQLSTLRALQIYDQHLLSHHNQIKLSPMCMNAVRHLAAQGADWFFLKCLFIFCHFRIDCHGSSDYMKS